ncbi:hypothetical protein Q5M85_08270 [Paraclostridium bifermentans]|nr:hypothetical protein [Paraclostridium bifermentans]
MKKLTREMCCIYLHSLEEAMMLDVRLSVVKHTDGGLKHWDELRLYHGTREKYFVGGNCKIEVEK